jgi:hypothetical protein
MVTKQVLISGLGLFLVMSSGFAQTDRNHTNAGAGHYPVPVPVRITFNPRHPKAGEDFTATIELDRPVQTAGYQLSLQDQRLKHSTGGYFELRPTGQDYYDTRPTAPLAVLQGQSKAKTTIRVRMDAKDSDSGARIQFPDDLTLTYFVTAVGLPGSSAWCAGVVKIDPPHGSDAQPTGNAGEFQKLLAAGVIKQMKTSSGQTGDSIEARSTQPGEVKEQTKYVAYVLDGGYVRYSKTCDVRSQSPSQANGGLGR